MNTRMKAAFVALVIAVGLIVTAGPVSAADSEAQMIQQLQSAQTPPAQKDQICQQLRMTGTVACVPAVAALLTDESLSQSARLVLQTMQAPEAGQALRDAIDKTTGITRAGIIDSLGSRRERSSVGVIAPLLKDADAMTATSAAVALGKIAGPEAVAALQGARATAPAGVRGHIDDVLLACADAMLGNGDAPGASRIYGEVFDSAKAGHIRSAAFRGKVLAAGGQGPAMVAEVLDVSDPDLLKVALQLVRQIKGQAATSAFAGALAKAPVQVQVGLCEALAQRGDAGAADAVASLARTGSAGAREAALTALGTLGDASNAMFLAEAGAGGPAGEMEAARQSLALVRDPKVCDTLLAGLPGAKPAVQAEIVRALGQRQETGAVPAMLQMAKAPAGATRLLALRSLAMLAGADQHGAIADLLIGARDDQERGAAERALLAACQRGDDSAAVVSDLLKSMKALPAGSVPSHLALLRVIGRLGGPQSLAMLRAEVNDADPAIADAAVRTMAQYGAQDVAGDLLRLAGEQQRPVSQHVQALRGYWRLVGQASAQPIDQRWRMCQAGMAASRRAEEKKLGLAEMARVPHPEALKLARGLCDDPSLRAEAESACVSIATGLLGTDPEAARAELHRLATGGATAPIRTSARKALDAVEQYVGCITSWSAAGPYRIAGKQYGELFNIAFAPEKEGAKVAWKPLAPASDPSLFWQADLLPVCGGDQCVVYARSRVFCPKQQKVQLDIGSDDGVKIWINGTLVHSNNVARPVHAWDDHASASLKEGWNDVLVKLTQNNQGCGVCIRIRATDGGIIDGLRCESGAQ